MPGEETRALTPARAGAGAVFSVSPRLPHSGGATSPDSQLSHVDDGRTARPGGSLVPAAPAPWSHLRAPGRCPGAQVYKGWSSRAE